MRREKSRAQAVLYRVFLVTCVMATALGLLVIWGLEVEGAFAVFLMRLLGSSAVLMFASALTMSATRLVLGRAPEDEDG